jgi:hypothetical protein
MKTVQDIQKEGTGHFRFRKGDISEIVKAAKAKKLEVVSHWNRKRGKASK